MYMNLYFVHVHVHVEFEIFDQIKFNAEQQEVFDAYSMCSYTLSRFLYTVTCII